MNNDQIIKNAQYRKGLSIAFFNATNAAIEMCKGMNIHEESTKNKLIEIRNWLLEEHKNYYASVIERVGGMFNAEETIKKLRGTKNLAELKDVWMSISEDERQDESVSKVKGELKDKYEKA